MKKITKTVYVVDGREYEDETQATLAARARRVEALLDTWANDLDLYGVQGFSASLAPIIVKNFADLMQAAQAPVPVEIEDERPDASPAEAPRSKRNAVQGHQKCETTNACMDCGAKFTHHSKCQHHVK